MSGTRKRRSKGKPVGGETLNHLAELERELAALGADELPRFAGELERLRAMVWARLAGLAANGQGQHGGDEAGTLLNAREAARRLSLSTDYLYRHAKTLPFTVRVGRQLRFSAQGIERYIRLRQGR